MTGSPDTETNAEGKQFSGIWHEYTKDHLHKGANLDIPEHFDRSEWETVGYIPPSDRSRNEIYNWSKFYDFWRWLVENDYIEQGDSSE